MRTTLIDSYTQLGIWLNDNQGVVEVAIFAATALFGWASGIFSALRRRPKFKVSLIDGPTFCCTYSIGEMHGQYEVHRTGIALYLSVINIGSSSSSIAGISIGYHWHLRRFSAKWLRYSVGWFWLNEQAVALGDFQVRIGESVKIYPFLTQRNSLSPTPTDTFLDVGRSANGVVYFEQADSWGGCFPKVKDGHVRLKIRVRDVFGGQHTSIFDVPSVQFEHARKFCPAFGKTLSELRGKPLPCDASNNSFKADGSAAA